VDGVVSMPKMIVMYYSRTGNTEKMARAFVEGAQGVPGVAVQLSIDFEVTAADLAAADALVVGMPTYHHDMTQSTKKVFEDAAVKGVTLQGKIGAAFGSYGWSGEAPRLVLEILKNRFEMDVVPQPLLIKYTPDATGLTKCRELGRQIAERLVQHA
jgi:flavodoxin I